MPWMQLLEESVMPNSYCPCSVVKDLFLGFHLLLRLPKILYLFQWPLI